MYVLLLATESMGMQYKFDFSDVQVKPASNKRPPSLPPSRVLFTTITFVFKGYGNIIFYWLTSKNF